MTTKPVSSQIIIDTNNSINLHDKLLAIDDMLKYGTYVTPEQFGAGSSDDDTSAITQAIEYAIVNSQMIYFVGRYTISQTITIPSNVSVVSRRQSVITKHTGSNIQNGVVISTGNAAGAFILPSLTGFTGVALDVRCNLAEIELPQILNCGTAIKIHSGSSNGARVLDTTIRFTSIGNCDIAVNFHMGDSTATMQGCGVYGNFITNTNSGVVFTGADAACDGLFLNVLAVDFTTGGGAMLDNQRSSTIPRFNLDVTSWFGGVGFADTVSPTQLVRGSWSNCQFNLVGMPKITQHHTTSASLVACRIEIQQSSGMSNRYDCVGSSGTLLDFNNGDMLYHTRFYVTCNITNELAPGAYKKFSFWHVFADTHYPMWYMMVMLGNNQMIVSSVNDLDSTETGKVTLTLTNISSTPVAADTAITLYVRRD